MDDATFLQSVEQTRAAVERRLAQLVPAEGQGPEGLTGAVRYALLAPGKRFRPVLTLLTARDFGAAEGAALDVACACEMVHAASLILDDLPSMDDAGLRRGRVTTHRAFDEATAILAAVGLLNRAFGVVAEDSGLSTALRTRLSARLSEAVGFRGLTAGQARDLGRRGARLSNDEIDLLNHQKTGVLLVAAAQAGALVAGVEDARLTAIGEFARRIGLAFQIRDDLIDAEALAGAGALEGKDLGKDAGMPTLITSLGIDGARRTMEGYLAAAEAALAEAGAGESAWRFARGLFKDRKVAA
ncbi:MAG: polyprenyl synthetase family protein [Caulobacter sp.]|nr:polyprenyl synthetase family protein [Caulobacter sp.]